MFLLRNIKVLHLRSAKVNRKTWIKMSPAQYFLISVSAMWSTIKRVKEDKFLNNAYQITILNKTSLQTEKKGLSFMFTNL